MAGAVNAVRERVRRHPRRAWFAAAVVLVLVATGLVVVVRSWAGAGSEFTVVENAHLNASRDLGMEEVVTAGFHEDALVILGKTTGTGLRVAVVEADTAEIRWVRDSGMRIGDDAVLDGNEQSVPTNPTKTLERPVITGSGDDWSVVVGYAVTEDGVPDDQLHLDTADVQERGVAALSGADGSVNFKQETPGFPRPLDADEDTVLVGAKHSEDAANAGDVTSVALDSSDDGAVRWEHEGDWVHTLAGDTALGESAPADWEPGADATNEEHQVFALETKTGQPAWDTSDDFAGSSVRAATDGRAVLDVDDGSATPNRNPIIDTATGAELSAPDDGLSGYAECATGTGGMLACVGLDETVEVMTVAPGEDEARVSTADMEFDSAASASAHMNSVAEGRVHFTLSSNEDDSGSERNSVAVDREGALLADDLPAAVGDTAGNNAVLDRGQPGDPWELTAHRSADDGAEPPAGPSSAPEVEPLAVSEEPLWGISVGEVGTAPPPPSTNALDLEGLSAVHLAGDTLVYAGETDDGYRVVAVDPATGEERWSEDRESPDGYRYTETGVPPISTGEDDDVLLIPDGPETDHDSVTAFSVSDGSVLWEEEVGSGDGSTRLAGGDDAVAAVSDHDREDGTTVAVRTELRDVADGSILHTKENVEPAGLGGGVVVGREHDVPFEPSDPADDVLGFDPDSGEEQWRLGDRYEQPKVLSVDDASVVLAHARGTAVLDPATGEEIGAAATRVTECFGTAEPLLACHVGDRMSGEVFPATVEVADGDAHVRMLPGLTGHTAHPGLGQWMPVTSEVAEADSQDRYQLRDAQGRQVTDGLAGWVAEVDDDHAVLVDGALGERSIEGVTVTVHERQ